MAQSSEGTLHFFRLFDLAFFAPGATVFAMLWVSDCVPIAQLRLPGKEGEATHGVVLLLLAIMASYVLGLLCQAVQRAFSKQEVITLAFIDRRAEGGSPPWYSTLPEPVRHELAIYFWYKRSTCWNLAVAAGLLPWISLARWGGCGLLLSGLICLPAGLVLTCLGRDFDRAMRVAVVSDPKPPAVTSVS